MLALGMAALLFLGDVMMVPVPVLVARLAKRGERHIG
jgi:hypothetical protein